MADFKSPWYYYHVWRNNPLQYFLIQAVGHLSHGWPSKFPESWQRAKAILIDAYHASVNTSRQHLNCQTYVFKLNARKSACTVNHQRNQIYPELSYLKSALDAVAGIPKETQKP